MSSRQNYIAGSHFLQTSYAMLSFTPLFVITRLCTTQILHTKYFFLQHLIIYLAYTFYFTLSILYILVTPILFRLTAADCQLVFHVCGGCVDRFNEYVLTALYSRIFASKMTVMALPVRLIWNLQIPQTQKFGIVALFGVEFILIAAATIETSIGVVIGCCPAFVTLIRNHTTPSVTYNTQGFIRQRQDGESRDGGLDDVKLNAILTGDSQVESSTKSADSKDRSWPSRPETRHEMRVGPNDRDVVGEVAEETPMGKKKIRVRRGAR